MLLLKITDVKSFMSKLLIKNVFDNFLMSELEIRTFSLFQIDGKLNQEWFDTDELEILQDKDYVKWEKVRPLVYQMVKGSKVPGSMKIVLLLSTENKYRILNRMQQNQMVEEVSQFFLNMKFEKGEMFLTTGVSYKIFTMDKTMQQQWELDLKKFLKYYEIEFEEIF